MAFLTVRNKLNQLVPSDKKSGITTVAYLIGPLATFAVSDDEIGPTMSEQINNGILQVISQVAAQDAATGFVADVDLAAISTRKILTVPIGEQYVVEEIFVRITESDTVSTDAEISVGVTGPNYEDVMDQRPMTQVRAVGDCYRAPLTGKLLVLDGPADVFVAVRVGATATALKATVWLRGTGE